MKIAIYAIAKNERAHVHRFVASARDADVIVVADTGSTDSTREALHDANGRLMSGGDRAKIHLHQISISPWRFDTARNVALALVPADVDVCVRLDLDEVLEPGWRAAIEAAWSDKISQLWYDFEHAPGYVFRANNIHARHGYLWRGLDHEGLYTAPGFVGVSAFAPGLRITHHQDRTKPRTAILGRLEAACREERSARNLWYLGREYSYYGEYRKCANTLHEYLLHPDACWDSERMAAFCMIGDSFVGLWSLADAARAYHQAAGECYTREPFLGLAELKVIEGKRHEARAYAQLALGLTNKLPTIHHNVRAWDGMTLENIARL